MSTNSKAPVTVLDLTNYWCRTLGIHNKDLDTHPQIDDVIILIKFIKEYQKEFKAKQTVEIYMMWNSCYNKRKPLKIKYLKALLRIGENLNHIRNLKAKARSQATQRIKALRKQ